MILDTSAVVAVLLQEPDHEWARERIGAADVLGIGTPTLTETGVVLEGRLGVASRALLIRFLDETGVQPLPFLDLHWRVAVEAFVRFGRGRHPAKLNLGDCLSYASAKVAGRPLLALGTEFAQTDLELVA